MRKFVRILLAWSLGGRAHRRHRAAATPQVRPVAAAAHAAGGRATWTLTSSLVLMLLISLGTIGVVNGLWSKNLVINGAVETGDLNADWEKIELKDVCEETFVVHADGDSGAPRAPVDGATTFSDGWDDDDHEEVDPCPPGPCDDSDGYRESDATNYYDDDEDCVPICDDDNRRQSGSTTGDTYDDCITICEYDPYRESDSVTHSQPDDDCVEICDDYHNRESASTTGGYDYDDDCVEICDSDNYRQSDAATGGYYDGDDDDICVSICDVDDNYRESAVTTGGYYDGDDHDDSDDCVPPPSCEAEIGGKGDEAVHGNQVAYLDITDAAPGYWCKIKAWITNTGSVPFNIIGIQEILDASNADGISFYDLNSSSPGVCKLIDQYGNTRHDRQVDPGEDAIVYCKVLIDNEEKVCTKWLYGQCKEWSWKGGAEFGWTYHFAVEVCVAQWNEDPSSGNAAADFAACKNPPSGTHEGPDTPALPTPGPVP